MRNIAKANDEDFNSPSIPPLKFFTRASTTYRYDVPIDEDIKDANYYREVSQLLMEASEDDLIVLHINSPGGLLSGAQTMIEALKNTEAHTLGILIGSCASAASLIAMYCMDIVVTDSADMLVHSPRGGALGKVYDMHSSSEHTMKMTNRLYREAYEGFLTEDEIKEVVAGKELWLDADQTRERFNARTEYFITQNEGEQPPELTPDIEVRPPKRERKAKEVQ